jgi:hypothetical protein
MRNAKPSFRQVLRKIADENSEKLMSKARTANRLAKLLNGKNRRLAYNIKSRTLCGLIRNLPGKVKVCKDLRLENFVIVKMKHRKSGLHLPVDYLKAETRNSVSISVP